MQPKRNVSAPEAGLSVNIPVPKSDIIYVILVRRKGTIIDIILRTAGGVMRIPPNSLLVGELDAAGIPVEVVDIDGQDSQPSTDPIKASMP